MSADSLDLLSARDRQGVAQHLRYAQERATHGRADARAATDATGNSSVRSQGQVAENGGDNFFGEDGFGFDDFLDVINPLQHLPIISTIYRAATGDEISPGARIIGGAVFGGPIGFAAAIANAAVEEASGKDIGAIMLAAIGLDGDDAPSEAPISAPSTMLAAVDLPTATPSAFSPAQGLPANVLPAGGTQINPSSTVPLSAITPAAGEAVSREQDRVDMPELSQNQVALLLRSVGLSQKDLPPARQVAMEVPSAVAAVNASLISTAQTNDPYWSARVMLETFGGYDALPDDTAHTRGKLVNSNL